MSGGPRPDSPVESSRRASGEDRRKTQKEWLRRGKGLGFISKDFDADEAGAAPLVNPTAFASIPTTLSAFTPVQSDFPLQLCLDWQDWQGRLARAGILSERSAMPRQAEQQVEFEVVNRFAAAESADHLLYAPLGAAASVRRSRVYRVKFGGDAAALETFVRSVLVDPIAQELFEGGERPWSGWRFVLERAIKAGALDNERETILAYARGTELAGFELLDLRLAERFYVFSEEAQLPTTPFVRDLVNEAVQRFELTEA